MPDHRPRRRLSPAAARLPRRSDTADYESAAEAERVGDHGITPELVAGAARGSRTVHVLPEAPDADGMLADLRTALWAEIRALLEAQQSTGKPLDASQRRQLVQLTDAATKLSRELRQFRETDDLERLDEAELWEIAGEPPASQPSPQLPANATDDGEET